MFWLKIIKDFLKILREGQTPNQIAWGFALGSLVGLSPVFTLQGLLVWILIFIFNVNLTAAFLSFTLFSIAAFLLDPLFHWFGFTILTMDSLKGLFTQLYNVPVAPLTRFNNTVVTGSFIVAIILLLPVYFGMKNFVIQYRKHIHSKVQKWKIYQIVNQSALVRTYNKIKEFGGIQ